MERKITVSSFPIRIISLVPSQTELLYTLGVGDRVVGVTKFCIHPDHWYRTKTRVGGTKKLNLSTIQQLSPDLIIANKEENDQDQIEALMKLYPVWISDIYTLDDSLWMIKSIGELTNTIQKGALLINDISKAFSTLRPITPPKKVIYLIWNNPIIAVGKNTFINHMLERCGFQNIIEDLENRYPQLSPDDIIRLNPDLILLSSEPFPFSELHKKEFQQLNPHAKIKLVDGEFFSWYGSRLLSAPKYFQKISSEI